MATYNDFIGFQSAWSVNGINQRQIVHSVTKADACATYGVIARNTSGASTVLNPVGVPNMGTITDGFTGVMKTRVRFRLVVLPNVDKALFHLNGGNSNYMTCGVIITSAGTARCYTNIVSGGPIVMGTASAALPLDEWISADITVTVTNSGASDTMNVDCTLTFDDATTDILGTQTSTPSSLGNPLFGTFSLWGVPNSAGLTTNWLGEIHFAQWILRAATNSDVASLGSLPPVTARIGLVKATANGAYDEIAGDTFHVFNKKVLFTNLTNDGSRSTSTAGQRASFVHETLASIGGTTTYGVKLIQVGTLASGTATASFLIGGSATAPSGGSAVATTITVSTLPWYADFTTRNEATFDALEFGVVSVGSGVLHRVGVLMVEVLYEGEAYTAEQFTPGIGFKQFVLSWTGDGTVARTLTGVGFRAMGVWVFPSGGSLGTFMAVEGMTHICDDTGTGSLISFFGFTADGMIVSDQLNVNAQNYRAVFVRDEGLGSPLVFRWTCGSLNQNEVYDFGPVVSMAPEAFVGYPARGASSGSTVMKHAEGMTTTQSSRWNTTTALSTNGIASFDANGFTTDTATTILFGTDSCAPFFAWGNLDALYEVMQFRRVPDWEGNTTLTTGYNVRFSFEDPTDTTIARPTINLLGHGLTAAGSPTTITVAGCVVADTADRGLLVIATSYGVNGTRSVTFDGDTVPLVYDANSGTMRTTVHYLETPDAVTGSVVWTSTSTVTSIKLAVCQVQGTAGIRSIHDEASNAGSAGNYSRGRDLIMAMIASDPLDSGSSYSETSGWTELFNDGSISAAAAAWWSTGLDTGTNMKSPVISETGGPDTLLTTFVAFMPAGIPDWNAAIFVIKGDYTTPAIAGVRLNHADYAGTSNSTLRSSAIVINLGIEALGSATVQVDQGQTGSNYLREAQAWYLAFTEEFTDERMPPEPGGETPGGTNPAPFVQPVGVLRVFVEFKFGSGSPFTHLAVAETTLRDPSSWYGGKKVPALLSVSEIERELTEDGSFRGSECRVIVADDGTFRTLAATETMSNAYAAVYVVSDETRYALGVPTRIFAGVIANHGALPGHRYEFVIRDILSNKIAILDASPRVPPERLSIAQFPGMEEQFEGRAAPLVIGVLSDTYEPGNFTVTKVPQGVVPPVILGTINLQVLGGPDLEVIAAIWSTGALASKGVWEVFYNTPTDTMQRIVVPTSAWGTIIWSPGEPGWEELGATTEYVDYPAASAETRRYTPFFILNSHPYAEAVREGRILVAGNLYGIDETGEGTGEYFSDAPRIWQWLIVNMLWVPYRYGAYAPVPSLDGTYSIIDTDTVDAATTYLRSRLTAGQYPVGFVLGRGGSQQTLRHVLQELCAGVLMEQGINRHGQLMVSVEDPEAAATLQLSDLLDIEDGEFSVSIDRESWCDRVEYTYGFRYVPMWAPPPTPPEGEALPARPLPPYHEWTSGLQVMESTAAIAANQGEVRTRTIENYVVRLAEVATDVTERLLERCVGPAPAYDGPRMFRLTTSWQGLAVELGSVIGITHVEGLGATGYEGERGYVTKIRIDPQRARISIEGRILGGA